MVLGFEKFCMVSGSGRFNLPRRTEAFKSLVSSHELARERVRDQPTPGNEARPGQPQPHSLLYTIQPMHSLHANLFCEFINMIFGLHTTVQVQYYNMSEPALKFGLALLL